MTIREALRHAVEQLEKHHLSNARLHSEVLLSHILDVDKTYLYAHDDRILVGHETEELNQAISDRIQGVPLQYIVGQQEFYGRNFLVTSDVLIPRPETENVIEAFLEFRKQKQAPACRVLDVGTGSGCLAVTIALESPADWVIASDISEKALDVARRNARALAADVQFVCADLIDGILGPFDFIVCNPPYVSPKDSKWLQREVRDHEPHIALFSPGDELAIYRKLIPLAREVLRREGVLIVEIGFGMEDRVLELFRTGWERLPTKLDLQGIPRTVIARVS